ncbi:MAG: Brp/Blh family beta-carotene 15,15'-dioxygenase [Armatimonadetes bacterium]|nr:Brp/Blh family beta-carotene 15,15'-dioxygenase [Armatimonadota bacterium]
MTDAAKNALRPYLTYPAWSAMVLVLIVSLLLPAPLVTKIAPYPFALSVVFLGLPHGAWDHRVLAAVRGDVLTLRHLSLVCGAYIVPMLAFGALFFALPGAAFIAFILLSWIHWGQGDAAYIRDAFPGYKAVTVWLVWLVRGGAPIVLPVLRFPETFARIARGVVGLFVPQSEMGANDWTLSPVAANAGLIVLGALVAVYVLLALRRIRTHRAAVTHDVGEIALLYIVFALSDPLLAVGVYFCFWHGLRHIGRLLLLDKVSAGLCAGGRVWAAGARFVGQCLPILLASLLILAGVYLWAIRAAPGGGNGDTALSVYLALIACLTFPHFLLVCWMDAARPVVEERHETSRQ